MENNKNNPLAIVALVSLIIALIPHFLTFCIIAYIILVVPYVCIVAFFTTNLCKCWEGWVFMAIPFTALMIFGILVTINNVMETFGKK